MVKRLRNYQRDVLSWMLKKNKLLLALKMRLGKTLLTIRWIRASIPNGRILIVGPNSVLSGWVEELISECVSLDDIIVLTGTRKQRFDKLCERKKWNLINKEGYISLPEIRFIDWVCVILDERFITNIKSSVTKFFLREFTNVQYKAILSGTPAPEGEHEYFSQLRFLDVDLGTENYYVWLNRNFIKPINAQKDNHDPYFIRRKAKKELGNKLAECAYFLSREDAGIKDERIIQHREITLSPKAHKAYNILEKAFVLEWDNKEYDKTIWATTRYIWMRRIVGGWMPDGENNFIEIDKGKSDELISLITGELKNESIIVWCIFIQELLSLQEKMNKSGISCTTIYGDVKPEERERRRRSFMCGDSQICLGHPACFRWGIDLSISDTMIYYDIPTPLEIYNQSRDRFVKIGKNNSLLELHFVVKDSIDESIQKAIKYKMNRTQTFSQIVHDASKRNHI